MPSNFDVAPAQHDGEVAPILHVTADNIDIQMDSFDGTKSLHGTQMVAFQRTSKPAATVIEIPSRGQGERRLHIPEEIQKLLPLKVQAHKIEPVFGAVPKLEWFACEEMPIGVQEARVSDLSFLLHRGKAPQVRTFHED